jgi:dTMP kinase
MPFLNSHFIVFEGLDGAGTTTQAARLQAYFTHRGTPSFLTNEPTSAPIGTFIRRLLTGSEPGPDGGPYRPGERTMGLLFAGDRLAHTGVIRSHLEVGEHVVCDRYLLSSMAYQTLDPEISGAWVIDVNRGCAIPDVTIFIEVPVDVCLARVGSRGDATSVYETRSHLETIARNYEKLLPLYESQFGRVLRVEGTANIDDIHARIMEGLGL